NLRFAEGGFDAGQITDGASTLFAFDNSDGTAEVTVTTNGDPFPVDLSTPKPSTVVAEWVAANPGGGNNIWRVNTVAGQFTVIPEPASMMLFGIAACACGFMRNRRS
ncbi:MAG: PEP-CTERM sorting domain-containing protein, partial [Pirellulales bacterium]|nr:PEP-CTERM sorting domain-containing protein [Pirellulales bacterium]